MSHLLTSLTILLSVLVLVGWAFDIEVLSQPIPKAAAMNPFTALCFILEGVSLIMLANANQTNHKNIIGYVLAFTALAVSTTILGEILFDSDMRIDTWLFFNKMDTGVEGFSLNYMAPNTAVGFILTSFSLLILNKQTNNKWVFSQLLALFVGLISMLTLLGYLYNVNAFYVSLNFFPMAIHTAIGFLFISMAILFVFNDKGFMSVFLGTNYGSVMSRVLLPAALIIPISLGFIRLYFEHDGLKYNELSIGLLVLSNMGVLIVLIWVAARELNMKDALRKETELAALETANRLELATKSGKIGIWEWNVANNELYWDEQMYALYGVSKELKDSNYETWLNAVHPEDKVGADNQIQTALKAKTDYSFDFRIVWPDSSIRTIRSTANIKTDNDGNLLGFIGINWDITELKQLENEIKQFNIELEEKVKDRTKELGTREKQLTSIFNTVADVLFVLEVEEDGNYRFNSVNSAFFKTTGLDHDQVVGKRVDEVIPEESLDFVLEKYEEAIRTRSIVRWEEENDYPAGKRFGDVSISPIFDENGNCTMLIGSVHNLTERKAAEKELTKSKLKYKTLLDKMYDGFMVDNREGKVIFANEKFLKIFGLFKGDVANLILENYVAPEFHEMLRERHDLRMAGEKVPDTFEYIGIRKDGKRIWVEVRVNLIIENATVVGTQTLVRDITELKNTELELLQSENRFRDLFENAPESILVLDLISQKFVRSNKNASKLFKFSDKELAELRPEDISPKFQPDGTLSAGKAKGYIEKVMLEEKVAFEWVHCDANKKEIVCEILLALLPNTDSSQIYASIVDITERNETREKIKQQLKELIFQNKEKEKRAAELIIANKELLFQDEEKEKRAAELIIANTELKKTNSELDRFVYSTSHDLRSPLKSLLGLSDLMIDDIAPDNTNQLELICMMKKSVVKLDNFIEDILQYSRNARTEVAKEAIDFKQTIDDITDNLRHMDGAKEIKLKMEIDQDLKFVSDRARINMILNNFISNSLNYKDPLKKHQFLGIQIKSSNDNAVITIEDNGIGINAKDTEKIFDMFYRGTNTSTGSGLGLYIVKEAIHKLEGSIKMESELTKGTKFIVTLPNQLLVLN